MRNQVALIVSVLCMGVALFATFSTDRVAGTAQGQTTEVSVSTTASPTTSAETSSPTSSATTLLPTPSVARKEVSQPLTPTTTTRTPGYGDDDYTGGGTYLCDVQGSRVCGVPDESGMIRFVCHRADGVPIRIVSNARNCK